MSWASHLAAGQRQWAIVALIEGVGRDLSDAELDQTTDGRFRFCSAIPAYASTEPASLWKPLFGVAMPDILSERLRPEGGVADDDASVALELVDVDDFLGLAIPIDAAPIGKLAAAVADGVATTVELVDKALVTATTVLYLDGEAMRVTTLSGSGGAESVDVARGYLATETRPHLLGASVYAASPFLAGRRIDLYLVPLDATSEDDRRLVGSYSIDALVWSEDLNSWTLQARAYVEALEATIPRYDDDWRQHAAYQAVRQTGYGPVQLIENDARPDLSQLFPGWAVDDWAWFLVGQELVALADWTSNVGQLVVRGAAETEVSDLPDGGAWKRVMAGNAFRFAPAIPGDPSSPSEDRGSGVWTITDDVIDLALILLTSSRHEDDGLELVNYVSGRPNYSSLPPGWGAGVPAADIDFDSADDVRARLSVRMPNVMVGKEPTTVRDILNDLLAPCGVHLVNAGGRLTFVLPRNPLTGEGVDSIDATNMLMRPGTPLLPDVDLTRELSGAAAEVRFALGPRKTIVSSRNVNPGRNRRTIDLEVPGASSADRYTWADLAQLRAWRLYRPVTRFAAAVDAALWGVFVGQYVTVTLPEAPDLETGARGWSSYQVLIDYREPLIEASEPGGGSSEDRRGLFLRLEGPAYGPRLATRRICPAAYVTAVTGTGPGTIATCSANRFTESDAPTTLPSQDVAAFLVGDVVRILSMDGTVPSGGSGTETVTAIDEANNQLELSGDWSSALTDGLIITFALADDANIEQRTNHAYYADDDDQLVGAGNFDPTPYSEP